MHHSGLEAGPTSVPGPGYPPRTGTHHIVELGPYPTLPDGLCHFHDRVLAFVQRTRVPGSSLTNETQQYYRLHIVIPPPDNIDPLVVLHEQTVTRLRHETPQIEKQLE